MPHVSYTAPTNLWFYSAHRSLDRFKKLQENMPFNLNAVTEKSDNQLVFAFWTCLQLER